MFDVPQVTVKKLDPKAIIPCKPKSFWDAGWDVFSLDDGKIIPPQGDALLRTGLKVAIPQGYCIQVNPRSGKATRDKLTIGARVIDSPYRGELMIHVFNNSQHQSYEVSSKDPVAQLLVLPCASLLMEGEIEDDTERGSDGFGSTNGALMQHAREKLAPHKPSLKSNAYSVAMEWDKNIVGMDQLDTLMLGNLSVTEKAGINYIDVDSKAGKDELQNRFQKAIETGSGVQILPEEVSFFYHTYIKG